MIKAIIFDCFGVLVEDSLEAFYRKYFNNNEKEIQKSKPFLVASNRGEISYLEFVRSLADQADISFAEARKVLDANPKNESLLEFIRLKLVGSYKIGFLSNASDDWLDELFSQEDIDLFDVMLLSYKLGFAKPEARAYEAIADQLGVRLDECIFTDNSAEYIQGAQGVGMHTILFKNTGQFIAELQKVL